MKVTKADIEEAEAKIDAAKKRLTAAVAAREAAQAAEKVAYSDVYTSEEGLNKLLAMKAVERLPADLATALISGTLTNEQWSSLVRRELAGKSGDRWSRNSYWLTRLGQAVQRILSEAAKNGEAGK